MKRQKQTRKHRSRRRRKMCSLSLLLYKEGVHLHLMLYSLIHSALTNIYIFLDISTQTIPLFFLFPPFHTSPLFLHMLPPFLCLLSTFGHVTSLQRFDAPIMNSTTMCFANLPSLEFWLRKPQKYN